jgi:hypothetical protein
MDWSAWLVSPLARRVVRQELVTVVLKTILSAVKDSASPSLARLGRILEIPAAWSVLLNVSPVQAKAAAADAKLEAN